MRCQVVNRKQVLSERYIAHDIFDLWRARMASRHQITVLDAEPHLWIAEPEQQRTRPFTRSARRQARVYRLHAQVFDPTNGVTADVVRYAPQNDLDRVKQSLTQRLDTSTSSYDLHVETGLAVAS